MRIAFFGSGSPLSEIALQELKREHTIHSLVRPSPAGRREKLKRLFGLLRNRDADAVRGADIIVVASFPRLIPADVLRAARLGGINLHQSLLPRGRGPDPIFWTYYDNEPDAGSTVHWLDERFDAGDVITQERMPVARGRSNVDLYLDLAAIGARQLLEALRGIERGSARRIPQNETEATYRPSPQRSEWRVRFDEWPAERTWHFLSGVGDMFGALAHDAAGKPMPVGRAMRYSIESHGRKPGTYDEDASGLKLYCSDGVVFVNRRAP